MVLYHDNDPLEGKSRGGRESDGRLLISPNILVINPELVSSREREKD